MTAEVISNDDEDDSEAERLDYQDCLKAQRTKTCWIGKPCYDVDR